MRLPSRILVGCIALLGFSLTAQPAAAAYTLNLNKDYSGTFGDLNAGTLQFQQQGANLLVTLTGGSGLNPTGYIADLYFNLSNIGSISASSFTSITKTGFTNTVSIGFGSNFINADGGGNFDVRVTIDNTPVAGRFQAGDSLSFVILNTTEAQAYVRSDISSNSGNAGSGLYAAVKAQSLGTTEGSDFYTDNDDTDDGGGGSGGGGSTPAVPAPAGIILLATALPVLGLRRVLRRKTA